LTTPDTAPETASPGNRPRDVRAALLLTPLFPFVALTYAGGLSVALLLIVVYLFAAFVFGQTGLVHLVAGAWIAAGCFAILVFALAVLPAWLASERRHRFRARWYNHWIFYVVFGVLTTGLYAASGAWRAQLFGYTLHRVTQPGMQPALARNDIVVVDTRAASVKALRAGDFVTYDSTTKPGMRLVRRVVALPGQRVEIDARGMRVDGKPVVPPVDGADMPLDAVQYPNVELAYDQYYLVGDERATSFDSRIEGPIPLRSLVGRVTLVWPADQRLHIRRVDAKATAP
jgi:signal peptidase I